MNKSKLTALKLTAAIALSLGLAACANDPFRSTAPTYNNSTSQSQGQYGTVSSIEAMDSSGNSRGIIGAVIGGLVGGVVGHQVGGGRGQTAATVGGAVGGAVVGNQIGERTAEAGHYRVTVRLDNGDVRTIDQQIAGDLRVGDRVRLDNNQVARY